MSLDFETSTRETIGPYQIVGRLGGGGMGEVFKAYDERLARWVAIKRIRPERRDTVFSRERFRREARMVAGLNHPAIVQVYDIFEEDDHDCIVMEYVEGENLSEILASGPLDPQQAATFGYEITAGLAAAHAQGVVHRDLKVENVIITPAGHAKILDFGLAKPVVQEDLEVSLTGEGQLLGTVRSMSPEHIRGETVDHRSDLFSLGVLLYEAVTGESPFAAENTIAGLSQVINLRQKSASRLNPSVPEELSDLADRLLEKKPEDRPDSTAEVCRELQKIAGKLSSSQIERPLSASAEDDLVPTSIQRTPTRSRLWILTGIAASLVLGAAALLLDRDARQEESTTPLSRVADEAVVRGQLENLTGEPLLDSLDTAFRVGLEQSRLAQIISDARIREVLKRMQRQPDTPIDRELGREICLREGARALITGSVVEIGGSYLVSTEIIDPQNGVVLWTESARASHRDQLIGTVEQVTRRVRAHLGESLEQIRQTEPLEQVTTRDLEALKMYSLGVARTIAGQDEAALPLFELAVMRDPEFAMAHAELGSLYRRLEKDPQQAAEHFDLALRYADRLTELERLYIQGWVATWRGPQEEMIRMWRLMNLLYPKVIHGYHNLGMAIWIYQNDFLGAQEAFDRALALQVLDMRTLALARRGYCELALGRFDDAIASFQKQIESDPRWMALGLFDAFLAADRDADSRAALDARLTDANETIRVEAELRKAYLASDRGQFRQAAAAAEAASSKARELQLAQLELEGQMARVAALEPLGEQQALRLAVKKALVGAEAFLRLDPEYRSRSPIATMVMLGKVSARNGDLDLAVDIYQRVAPLAAESGFAIWKTYAAILEGEILAARGQLDEALAVLRQAESTTETFQGHESSARIHAEAGNLAAAITEYEWILANRGWALAECLEVCKVQIFNLIDWSRARARLARLYAEAGDSLQAARTYRTFMERWQRGDRPSLWQQASTSLERLEPVRAASADHAEESSR